MSETRIGIIIDANIPAVEKIRLLEAEIKRLEHTIASIRPVSPANLTWIAGLKDDIAFLNETIANIGAGISSSTAAQPIIAQAIALERLKAELSAVTSAKERLNKVEQETARIIAEGARERGVSALQYGYLVTGRPELVEQHRDERGRFVAGQGAGPLATAIVGAEADLAKEEALVKLRRDSANAIAFEKQLLAEKADRLKEETAAAQAAADARAALNQKLMADAAAVHANEARIRAERLAGFEEEKRLGAEAAELKRQFYKNAAHDAATAAAAEAAGRSKSALGLAGFTQMPITQRMRLWGGDEATQAAAGLNYYQNAAAPVRATIENIASAALNTTAATHGMSSALGQHTGHVREATRANQGLAFAIKEIAIELGESARGARGQQMSTFISAMRQVGVGPAALRIGAPLAVTFAAVGLEHLVTKMGELAEKTQIAATSAGMGTQQYSQLQRTLFLLTGDIDRVNKVLGTFSVSINQALTQPSGEQGSAFARILGPDWDEQIRKMSQSPEGLIEGIELLRRKFQEMGPSLATVEAFRQAFKQGWEILIPVLRASRGELDKIEETLRKNKSVLGEGAGTDRLVESAHAANRLSDAFHGLGIALATLAAHSEVPDFFTRIVNALTRVADRAALAREGLDENARLFEKYGRRGDVIGLEGVAGPSNTAESIQRRLRGSEKFGPPEPFGPPMPSAEVFGPPIPLSSIREQPALYGPFDAQRLSSEANEQAELIRKQTEIQRSRYNVLLAEVTRVGDRDKIRNLEDERDRYFAQQVEAEKTLRIPYGQRIRDVGGRANEITAQRAENSATLESEANNVRAQGITRNIQLDRQAYDEDIALLRARVSEARGSWAEISDAYQQMLARTRELPGGGEKERLQITRDYVRASQDASDKVIQDQLRVANNMERVDRSAIRARVAQVETQTAGTQIGRGDNIAAAQVEVQMTREMAAQEIAAYQEIANTAGITAEKKIEALDKALKVAEDAAAREAELAHKVADVQKRAAEESSRAFVQFFDKTGSAFENLVDAAVFKTKTRSEAFRDFFLDIDKEILHTTEKLASQFAAQGLAKAMGVQLEPGKGLSDLFGNAVGKLFGLGEKQDYQSTIAEATQASAQSNAQATELLSQIKVELASQKQKLAEGGMPQAVIPGGINTADREQVRGYPLPEPALSSGPASNALVAAKARQYGLNPNFANAVADIESSHGTNMGDVRKSQYAGNVFQVGPEERRMLGVSGMGSTEEQVDYGVRLLAQRRKELSDKLGREVTNAEVYLAHQQGVSGAAALITHPSVPAGELVPGRNISANMGDPSRPASEFVSLWEQKVQGRAARYAGMESPQTTEQGNQAVTTISQATQATTELSQSATKAAQNLNTLASSKPVTTEQNLGGDKGITIGGGSLATEPPKREVPYGSLDYFTETDLPRIKSAIGYQRGGVVQGFAEGGMAKPPAGSTDTVLAWLTPKERVLTVGENKEYERKFPQGILSYQTGGLAHGQEDLLTDEDLQESPERAAELTRLELMSNTPGRHGFALREESESSTYKGSSGRGLGVYDPITHLGQDEAFYWVDYAKGLQQQGLSANEMYREADRVAPLPSGQGIYSQAIKEHFLSGEEISSITAGGVYHGGLDQVERGYQFGGEVFSFASGGSAPPIPYTPNKSPITTPTLGRYEGGMGGFSVENRGFVAPQLITTHPKPKLGLLSILGFGLLGVGAIAGISKLFGDRDEKKAKRLLEAKDTDERETISRETIPLALESSRLSKLTSQQISGLSHEFGGVIPGFQSGGEIQLAGDVIPFPSRNRAPPLPDPMEGLRANRAAAMARKDFGDAREIESQILALEQFRTPKMQEGGIIEDFQQYLTRSYQHLAEGGDEAWRMLGETAQGYLGQTERIKESAATGLSLPPEETAGFLSQHILGGVGTLGKLREPDITKISNQDFSLRANARLPETVQFDPRVLINPKYRSGMFEEINQLSRQYPLQDRTIIGMWKPMAELAKWDLLEPAAAAMPASKYKSMGLDNRILLGETFFSEDNPFHIRTQEQVRSTVAHEYGHLMDYDLGPKSEPLRTRAWQSIFTGGQAPSEYGKTSAREFFAEDFSALRYPGTGLHGALPSPFSEELKNLITERYELLPRRMYQEGGEIPGFHTGGLANDELLAKLQTGERVLSREQNNRYERLPEFHGGGLVYPAFAEGGEVGGGNISAAPVSSSSSGESTRAVYSSITSLSSNLSTLSSDVGKVASGFKSLERASVTAEGSTGKLSSTLSAAGSAVSGFQSILSLVGGGSGGGGFAGALGGLGSITKLFGFASGGEGRVTGRGGTDSQLVQFMATPGETVSIMTAEQKNNLMIGGLPHFAGGGLLNVGGNSELTNSVSNIADRSSPGSSTGGPGEAGPVNVHVGIGSIHGVLSANEIPRLLMDHYSTITKAVQRGARGNFSLPGR